MTVYQKSDPAELTPLLEFLFTAYAEQMQQQHTTVALQLDGEGLKTFYATQDADVHAERQIGRVVGPWILLVTKPPCEECITHLLADLPRPKFIIFPVVRPLSKWFDSSLRGMSLLTRAGFKAIQTSYPLIIFQGPGHTLSWD